MTELELWVENNYPDIYDEWVRSVSMDEDIEDWLGDNHYGILSEYEDWLDGWLDWEEEEREEHDNE